MSSTLKLLVLLLLTVWIVQAQPRRYSTSTNKSYTYYECCGNIWNRRFNQGRSQEDMEKNRQCLLQFICNGSSFPYTPASQRSRPSSRHSWNSRAYPNTRSRQNYRSPEDLDFDSIPAGYKPAFMSVEELINNRDMIKPDGPNYRDTFIIFDNQTESMFYPDLKAQVDDLLPVMVPGTWRTMTYIEGCCPVLRYHAANRTMLNLRGTSRRIVHFDKYYPPMYQFIPHGLCTGTFRNCRQGTVTMSLLVYDLSLNPPLSFDVFSVPSYCNCYNY